VQREAVSGPDGGDERACAGRLGGPGLVPLRARVPSGHGEVHDHGRECEQGSHEQQIGKPDRSR
jgi:hypothetical protein